MFNYINKLAQVIFLLIPLHMASADQNSKNSLKGNYAFTGVYFCLDAPGGFNTNGQPVNPQNSIFAYISINGFMKFDGAGSSTQNGNFVETEFPASPANTTSIPAVGSGTFTMGASDYTVSNKGEITVKPGVTKVEGLTGIDVGVKLLITYTSGELSGFLAKNGNIVLTTPVPLKQQTTVFINGNEIITLPRQCSLTMTLIPAGN